MDTHLFLSFAVFFLSFSLVTQALPSPPNHLWRLKHPLSPRPRSSKHVPMQTGIHESQQWTTKYFTQALDHFSFTPLSISTFQQKYILWDKHWGGAERSAPIFVYCGNEGPVEWFADNAGFIKEIAGDFQALVVAVEHRYYGVSMPFGSTEAAYKDGKSLAFLTTEQAIADAAILLTDLKKNLSAEHSPIVLFGGSYGGMIAAWFRLKYPHIAVGAIASSAPILQFGDAVPADTFYRIVSEDFRRESESCFQSIRESWAVISAVGSTTEGLRKLSKIFGICRELESPEELKDWLDSAYSYLAMVDYPLPADFLMPLPAYPVRELCKAMDALPPGADLMARISAGVNVYYNYSGDVECFEPQDDPHGMSGWDYQYCTEMTMPFASNSSNSMFEPFDWDLEAVERGCEEQFGVKPRPQWVLTHFGGKNINVALKHFGSNIIFSNGALDPWSGGGVTESISDSVVASVIPDGAHHLDLRSSTPFDPPSVTRQREFEKKSIRRWLSEYYSSIGLSDGSYLSVESSLFSQHRLKVCAMAALLGILVLYLIAKRLFMHDKALAVEDSAIHMPFLEGKVTGGTLRSSRPHVDTMRILLVALLLPAVAFAQDFGLDSGGDKPEEKNSASLPAELVVSNFNSSLWAATEPWALLEFYAHWCPACQHFKPHYERVAELFMSPSAPYPQLIYVARVDCADQGELCIRFDVTHYPTMFFGPPSEMATAFRKKEEMFGKIELAEGYSDAHVASWLSTRLKQTFEVDPIRREQRAEEKRMVAASVNMPATKVSLHDIEEATAVAFEHLFSALRLSPTIRRALVKVLPVLAAHHPSSRCRQGSASLLALLDDVWPQEETEGESNINVAELKKHKICGAGLPRGYWNECKGSKEGRRGYSCGLWLLFHSLTVQLDASEGASGLAAVHAFVEHFFGCGFCRKHFMAMAKRRNVTDVTTGRGAVLWLWGAHNEVNARLAEEEVADLSKGDPMYPKQQWPLPSDCPSCRKGGEEGVWDLNQVYLFLVAHFKHPLEDHSPEEPDSAARKRERERDAKKGNDSKASEKGRAVDAKLEEGAHVKDRSKTRLDYVIALCLFILVVLGVATCRSRPSWPAHHRRRKLSRRFGTLPM